MRLRHGIKPATFTIVVEQEIFIDSLIMLCVARYKDLIQNIWLDSPEYVIYYAQYQEMYCSDDQ